MTLVIPLSPFSSSLSSPRKRPVRPAGPPTDTFLTPPTPTVYTGPQSLLLPTSSQTPHCWSMCLPETRVVVASLSFRSETMFSSGKLDDDRQKLSQSSDRPGSVCDRTTSSLWTVSVSLF